MYALRGRLGPSRLRPLLTSNKGIVDNNSMTFCEERRGIFIVLTAWRQL